MNSCHVKMIDTQINVALRLVCGVVQPTELEWLYVLSNIVPACISREESALQECRKISLDQELPIYNDIIAAPNRQRLKSRKPFWCFYRNAENMSQLKERWTSWWYEASVHN